MIKPFKTLSEIPYLIKNLKYLIKRDYLSIENSKSLLHQCSYYADKCRSSDNNEEAEEAQLVIQDLIKFSHWLRKKDLEVLR